MRRVGSIQLKIMRPLTALEKKKKKKNKQNRHPFFVVLNAGAIPQPASLRGRRESIMRTKRCGDGPNFTQKLVFFGAALRGGLESPLVRVLALRVRWLFHSKLSGEQKPMFQEQ